MKRIIQIAIPVFCLVGMLISGSLQRQHSSVSSGLFVSVAQAQDNPLLTKPAKASGSIKPWVKIAAGAKPAKIYRPLHGLGCYYARYPGLRLRLHPGLNSSHPLRGLYAEIPFLEIYREVPRNLAAEFFRRAARRPVVIQHDRVTARLVATLDHRQVALGCHCQVDAKSAPGPLHADHQQHAVINLLERLPELAEVLFD
jgi:hypothetical protein